MRKYIILLFFLFSALCFQKMQVKAQTWPPAGMQGTGTSSSPWEITTPAHLSALAAYVNAGNGNQTS